MERRKESPSKNSVSWYLRAFSYLLIIWGIIDCLSGAAVLYEALATSFVNSAALSLTDVVLGLATVIVSALTTATGFMGLTASRNPARLESLNTVAVAGTVATVLGLGLCSAVGNDLPTSLLFNGMLLIICLVVTTNLRRHGSGHGHA